MNDEADTNTIPNQIIDNGKQEDSLVCNAKQNIDKKVDIDSTRVGKYHLLICIFQLLTNLDKF